MQGDEDLFAKTLPGNSGNTKDINPGFLDRERDEDSHCPANKR